MKTIKDRKFIDEAYCLQVGQYIKDHASEFFSKDNEADDWHDFCLWPDSKSDRNHLIMPGEICIIDRTWNGRHAYVVCQFYGNKHKVRDLYLVIYVDGLPPSEWRNGYFLIPDLRTEGQV